VPDARAAAPLWRARHRLAVVVGPPTLVAVLAVSVLLSARRYQAAREWVRHGEAVRAAALVTLSHAQDAETGQRGFLLTGDSAYLAPFAAGTTGVAVDTERLRRLTRDNAAQQRRLDTVGVLVRAKFAELDSTIRLRAAGRADDALAVVRAGAGKREMDSLRAQLGRVVATEDSLLAARDRTEARAARRGLAVVVLGALLTALLTTLVVRLLARAAARHAAQAAELEAANLHLQEQAVELEAQQTELERQTDELLEANRAKSELLSTMSHELRTPLNAIAGYTQLIDMEIHGPVSAAQRDALARITRAQQHLLSLINDILNLSRIEAGKLDYDMQAVVPADAVADVVPMIEPQLSAKGVALAVDDSLAAAAPMWADRDRLRQVLLNLLSNAAKFTPPNGRVVVDAVAPGDGAALVGLRVRDTGRGIPADKLAAVFGPFVQVHRDVAGRDGSSLQGTGLGLTISRDLVRGMGGELELESRVGEGSSFTILLRRADDA
jgi:signal transduction histidine kinase